MTQEYTVSASSYCWCLSVCVSTVDALTRPRDGPGEGGKPVVIPKENQEKMKEMFKINQFNLMASEMIALNRSLPDVRLEGWVDLPVFLPFAITSFIVVVVATDRLCHITCTGDQTNCQFIKTRLALPDLAKAAKQLSSLKKTKPSTEMKQQEFLTGGQAGLSLCLNDYDDWSLMMIMM